MLDDLRAEDDAGRVIRVEEDTARDVDGDELVAQSDLTRDDIEAADEIAKEQQKGRPAVLLTEYQKLIVNAVRKFIALMVCRQGGKTFASTLRIARKLLTTPHPYYILSRSERQSGNAVAQLVVHLKAIEKALRAKGKNLGPGLHCQRQRVRYRHADGSDLDYTRLSVNIPNGGRAVGLPASPDTVMGITGSVYGDEFALHRDSRTIYGRLFPVISRRANYEMLLTSTPRGVGNKFYEIMTSQDYEDIFLRLVVDIHKAVEQGLVLFDYEGKPIRDADGIERLRKALKDPSMWDEEYLCRFVDDVLNLLTYEMISRCEKLHDVDGKPYRIFELDSEFDPERSDAAKLLEPHLHGGPLYLGFDQARRRNLSVIWVDEELNGELWQRALIVMKDRDYEWQEAILWQLMAHPKLRKAGIDATGIGARTGERTVTRFGDKALAINFSSKLQDKQGYTHPVKALLARVIRERHQDGVDHYPVIDQVREDLHKVKQKRGGSPDQFTYFADDDETGHADIFTAKALSDVVFQELQEFGGRVDGMRIVPEQKLPVSARRRPDHSDDIGSGNSESAKLAEVF